MSIGKEIADRFYLPSADAAARLATAIDEEIAAKNNVIRDMQASLARLGAFLEGGAAQGIVGYLAEIAAKRATQIEEGVLHDHGDIDAQPDGEFEWYRLLSRSAECLIDCAGYAFPDYRAKLMNMAAQAIAAAQHFDGDRNHASHLT